jgi:hypothetical protein
MRMEDKEAAEILQKLLTKYPLDEGEQEAVKTAIGVLGWTKLVEGFVERRKQARDRRLNDE